MMLKSELNRFDSESRRAFMLRTAKTALGVTMLPVSSKLAQAAAEGRGGGKAKHVIYLYMAGGMSHIDTFDPKTGETKGAKDPIKTNAEGMMLGGYMEQMAKQANKIAIIRSMTSKTGVHDQGNYLMHTGYEPRGTIVHPTMGAWASHFLGRATKSLPDSVSINGGAANGAGFFPPALSPIPISNPETGLQNIQPTTSESLFKKRIDLMNEFDAGFRKKFQSSEVKAYTEFYDETLKLLKSEDLKAFDLKAEDQATRAKYGMNSFGQGCLLARRLVERGVRFVSIMHASWDHHSNLNNELAYNAGMADQPIAALVKDLKQRGLLDSTMVVWGSEFGRTPLGENRGGNPNATGRDHHPFAFTMLMAGGGIKAGHTYGETDEIGWSIVKDPVHINDFHATMLNQFGFDHLKLTHRFQGRDFRLTDVAGKVIKEWIA